MLALLAPAGLVALAALALPIIIHLVRRSERKIVDFAALRWLAERSHPRRQIRLHEWLLLTLRLLLLTTLALLLSGLAWRPSSSAPGSHWIAVVPGVDASVARAAAADSTNAEWHWLAPGFPDLSEPMPAVAIETASLIRELDARLPPRSTLSAVVPGELAGLDARRLQLSHAVDWRVLPGVAAPVSAPQPSAALKISVRYDDAGRAELPTVRAIAQAWTVTGIESTLDLAGLEVPIPDEAQLVFWLARAPGDAFGRWIANGGTGIVTRSDDHAGMPAFDAVAAGADSIPRWLSIGRGHRLAFPVALRPDRLPMLAQADFPERLRRRVLPEPAAPDRAQAESFAPSLSAAGNRIPARPLGDWLAVIAALLFLAERWLATGMRRGAE